MKKWLLPYLFLFSISYFPIVVLAIQGKSFQEKNRNAVSVSKTFTFKKTLLTAADQEEDKNADVIFHYCHGLNILCAATSYDITEPTCCLPFSGHGYGVIISSKEVESEVMDRQQHLFPSHYFW